MLVLNQDHIVLGPAQTLNLKLKKINKQTRKQEEKHFFLFSVAYGTIKLLVSSCALVSKVQNILSKMEGSVVIE